MENAKLNKSNSKVAELLKQERFETLQYILNQDNYKELTKEDVYEIYKYVFLVIEKDNSICEAIDIPLENIFDFLNMISKLLDEKDVDFEELAIKQYKNIYEFINDNGEKLDIYNPDNLDINEQLSNKDFKYQPSNLEYTRENIKYRQNRIEQMLQVKDEIPNIFLENEELFCEKAKQRLEEMIKGIKLRNNEKMKGIKNMKSLLNENQENVIKEKEVKGMKNDINDYTDEEILNFIELIKDDYKNFEKLPTGITIDDIVLWAYNKKGCPKIGRERNSYINYKYSEASRVVDDIVYAKIPINSLSDKGEMSLVEVKKALRLKEGLSSRNALRVLSACEKELFEINKVLEESPNGIKVLKQNIEDEIRYIVQQIEDSENTRANLELEVKEIKKELEYEKEINKSKLRIKMNDALDTLEALEINQIPETYNKRIRKLRRRLAIIEHIEEKNQRKDEDCNEQEM